MMQIFKQLIVLLIMATGGYAQTLSLNLSMDNTSVRELLKEIERQTELSFIFSDDISSLDNEVSVNLHNRNIKDVLRQVLKGTDLDYQILNERLIVIAPKKVLQDNTITGTVTDEAGEPLPGATVTVKGTTQGTVTDVNGGYSLQVANENATLVFSYIGFATQEKVVGRQRSINVVMREDVRQIEEVVVVGYGQQRVTTVTGSVSQIKSDKITAAPVNNVTNVLAGQLPGLITKQSSGLPGADGSALTIRSFGGGPLVIVDGMENSFGNLDMNQIETISILKDGAASIYGARAGNGVILITTKRGSQSKPKVTVNSSMTLQGSTKVLKPANSAERAQIMLDNWLNVEGNDPSLAPYSEHDIEMYRLGTDPKYPNTDWFDAAIRKYAPQQNHNLAISGGNEAVRYYGYVGYNSQETILRGN